MDHVVILRKAIIKKDYNLLGNILAGDKTIESRWYVNRIAPWNRIKVGDTLYFKESGGPVSARAKVSKVLQFEDLTEKTITQIITKYGNKIAPNISTKEFLAWARVQNKKRYCILIFFKEVKKIKPFNINKKGYGISAAWLVTEDIRRLKKL